MNREMNLHLFEDGAPAGGAGGSGGQPDAAQTAGAQPEEARAGQTKPEKTGGKKAPDAAERASQRGKNAQEAVKEARAHEKARAKQSSFETLIRGEYKEIFEERVQKIINGRFRETKETQEQLQKANAVLGALADKYQIGAQDVDSLYALVTAENAQQAGTAQAENETKTGLAVPAAAPQSERAAAPAPQSGATPETAPAGEPLPGARQNEGESPDKTDAQEAFFVRQYAQIRHEGERLREIYPNFDLRRESSDPRFVELVCSGVGVRTAYEALHQDEILGGAMQYTAKQIAAHVANRIRARGARPLENGIAAQGSFLVKPDLGKMSRAERETLRERVARGEKLVL